jgi:hypothetical protein
MLPTQPVKMMRYRGADDAAVGYGHFAETRRLQTGPDDVVVPYKGDANEEVPFSLALPHVSLYSLPCMPISYLRPSPLYTRLAGLRRVRGARDGQERVSGAAK